MGTVRPASGTEHEVGQVAVAEGDEDAIARTSVSDLYDLHINAAIRLAFLLTGDRSAAEDVAQEAFLRSASRRATLRRPDAFGAYLRRAVIREVAATARSSSRRLRRERLVHEAIDDHVAGAGSPDLDSNANIDFVRLVRDLPERQRIAVVLRFGLDLSEEQVADAMKCPRGTVKSTISRALATLRTEIATRSFDDEERTTDA